MATKFIGFDQEKKGTFTNKTTGEVVTYSKRQLNFATSDAQDNTTYFGYAGYSEEGLPISTLAKTFNVENTDEAVNNYLVNCIGKFVEVLRIPKNNELICIGFRLVDKK